jgi:hypothetical protein
VRGAQPDSFPRLASSSKVASEPGDYQFTRTRPSAKSIGLSLLDSGRSVSRSSPTTQDPREGTNVRARVRSEWLQTAANDSGFEECDTIQRRIVISWRTSKKGPFVSRAGNSKIATTSK